MLWKSGHTLPAVGPCPTRVTCPSCDSFVRTRVVRVTSKKGYLFAILMCAFGCFLCSCLPFCMSTYDNFKHSCPDCKAHIGTFKPSSFFKQFR